MVAEFIPIVGTYIAGAVPVLIALAAVGLTAAVIVLAEIVAYQQLGSREGGQGLHLAAGPSPPALDLRCSPSRSSLPSAATATLTVSSTAG